MKKKWAITLVVLGEVLIYLFLLVAVPAYQRLMACGDTLTALYTPSIIAYFIPGLIGIMLIVVILKQKEGNDG